jgi:DMSO/TMAO reductase YedYZ molybdopterin-dependent catalytic subunit
MITQRRRFAVFVFAALVAATSVNVAAQTVPKPVPAPKPASQTGVPILIQVVGEVAHPLGLSGEAFAKLPHQTVRAKGHDGVESQFDGVPLIQVLAEAGVPTGKDLRGPAMALYVVVEAADGYRAVFALAELDAAFTDRVILLADHRDGKTLSARDGPFQMIVPGEKKHARWVRQVITLKVGRA